ncbi:MAG: anhydro-N-acetylmuramic acid kinase [Bacteroidetes bacterium]|nr:anhydro-N-acetylmuramic acid kinase [Bacteroidota bacterium]
MVYKVIGLMSGSSLDGLDIAYVHLQEKAATGKGPRTWEYTLVKTACYDYSEEWKERLTNAPSLSALDYQLLHTEYGHYLGEQVLKFIDEFSLYYQVQLIASHGHTAFHLPAKKMTAQLGDGAAIAAKTKINVVSDLRALDVALGGQGAPIVPIGERLLFPEYDAFLNLGGIANIARKGFGFDVCPANRVLNVLASREGFAYDEGGKLAAAGKVNDALLQRLNALPYYQQAPPKSLANEFGIRTVLPMLDGLPVLDGLRTYVEHIAIQIANAAGLLGAEGKLLITGGGVHNEFLIARLLDLLKLEVVLPDTQLADYKEALIMALIGVLRWREENNVLASVTGASRDSIGGAVWIGQEA